MMPGKLTTILAASFILSACAHSLPAAAIAEKQRCPGLKLRFVIDRGYDARMIYSVLHGDDPAGLVSRAASMGIHPELAAAIHAAASYEGIAGLVASAVESRYRVLGGGLARARAAYERAWTSLVTALSQRVTSLTGRCWIHAEYRVVVSAFHPGLSAWNGNTVASKFDHELASKRRVAAHEIVLSQVFQLLRAGHPREEVGDRAVWAFAEITAAIVLDDPALRQYWSKFPSENYFARSNYPQLASLETVLRRRFRESATFDEYLSGAVPILKRLERESLLHSTK